VTDSTTVKTASNHTLYAKWEANTYVVTFDAGEGTVSPSTQSKRYDSAYGKDADGEDAPLPVPVREGYTFLGWYDGSGGTGNLVTDNTTVKTASNHTLYAKWEPSSYMVSFDAGGGTVSPSTQTKRYDSTYGKDADGEDEPLPVPAREGYTFLGWYDGVGGTGNRVTDNTTVKTASNHMLYAKWEANPYVVSFDAGGGAVSPSTQTKRYDSTYGKDADGEDEPLPVPAREGYTFLGWYDGVGGTGNLVTDNTTVKTASNHTLYAKWILNAPGQLTAVPGDGQVELAWISVTASVYYEIYFGLASGLYDPTPVDTVTGDVYAPVHHYTVTGLANGTTYYFIVKATNAEGYSFSNEASATPLSGNADLDSLVLSNGVLEPQFHPGTVSYTASVSYGVSQITVTASAADSAAVLEINGLPVLGGTPSEPLTLDVGDNTIHVQVTAQDGTKKLYTVIVRRNRPIIYPPANGEPERSVRVEINGRELNGAANVLSEMNDGRESLVVAVKSEPLLAWLDEEEGPIEVAIRVQQQADEISVTLAGDVIKAMETKRAVLLFQTPNGDYILPASEIWIDRAMQWLDHEEPADIEVRVTMAVSGPSAAERLGEEAEARGARVLSTPVDFEVTVSHGDRRLVIDRFNTFVERYLYVPQGVNPDDISTAVVLEADGTLRPVPTRVTLRDGRVLAIIRSMTNSSYALIGRQVEFSDMGRHWAQAEVYDLASRLVINGVGQGRFAPDQPVTRAEFAAILVRALGLPEEEDAVGNSDVNPDDWFAGAVAAARQYGIVSGYADGTFRPNQSITRQEAMVMVARALKLAGLETDLPDETAEAALGSFADGETAAQWAKSAVAAAVEHGLIKGYNGELRLSAQITRAETAVIVHRLLLLALGND